jgi:hypothetical protein
MITSENLRAHAERLTNPDLLSPNVAFGAAQALSQAADYLDSLKNATPSVDLIPTQVLLIGQGGVGGGVLTKPADGPVETSGGLSGLVDGPVGTPTTYGGASH